MELLEQLMICEYCTTENKSGGTSGECSVVCTEEYDLTFWNLFHWAATQGSVAWSRHVIDPSWRWSCSALTPLPKPQVPNFSTEAPHYTTMCVCVCVCDGELHSAKSWAVQRLTLLMTSVECILVREVWDINGTDRILHPSSLHDTWWCSTGVFTRLLHMSIIYWGALW